MTRFLGVVVCLAALVPAAPAWAQAKARVFVHFEAQSMTAKDSFDATMGTATLKGLGGAVEAQGIWRRLFVRAAVSRMSQTGERVFVLDGDVFPLGIPLDVTLTPIETAVGWRFKPMGSRGFVPYIGAGALFLKYREQSDADATGEGVNKTYNGVTIFGGVDVPVWRSLSAGAEVGWRKAEVEQPGGALQAFGEKDLGGVTLRLLLSFRK